MSGARIGMVRTRAIVRIRRDLLRVCSVFFAVGAGTIMPAAAAPRIATGTGLATASTTAVSASFAPQDHMANEEWKIESGK